MTPTAWTVSLGYVESLHAWWETRWEDIQEVIASKEQCQVAAYGGYTIARGVGVKLQLIRIRAYPVETPFKTLHIWSWGLDRKSTATLIVAIQTFARRHDIRFTETPGVKHLGLDDLRQHFDEIHNFRLTGFEGPWECARSHHVISIVRPPVCPACLSNKITVVRQKWR